MFVFYFYFKKAASSFLYHINPLSWKPVAFEIYRVYVRLCQVRNFRQLSSSLPTYTLPQWVGGSASPGGLRHTHTQDLQANKSSEPACGFKPNEANCSLNIDGDSWMWWDSNLSDIISFKCIYVFNGAQFKLHAEGTHLFQLHSERVHRDVLFEFSSIVAARTSHIITTCLLLHF